MIDGELTLSRAGAVAPARLSDYLDANAEEAAHEAAYRWIKDLRHAPVDGVPFRDRFRLRDDSLWWFTELYLHKRTTVLDIHRILFAFRRLLEQERPSAISDVSGSALVRDLVARAAAASGVGGAAGVREAVWLARLARLDGRARLLHMSAVTSRERARRTGAQATTSVAAFVHRAFWRAGGADGSAESYAGPVLTELERRLGADAVRYIGVGPAENFRVHRPLRGGSSSGDALIPVERFAPRSALREARQCWRARYANFRALVRTPALRAAAIIETIDCWSPIREELAGIAWLQWPWSARAMDEAGAALDTLRPAVAVTYAEAGGWGRALVLECRRRGIPSVGLQHGFIYRHWLNYRHEPDEMREAATPPFPLPTRTLVFDEHACRHLREQGCFPAERVSVTGSARLDELRKAFSRVDANRLQQLRATLGVLPHQQLCLIATKEREARSTLGPFLDAAASVPDAVLVIKPHPAEPADAYAPYLIGRAAVRITQPDSSLAELLAAARLVVTVNSTVALDAGALGVPALTIGLPNNLTPFVDAGTIAGVRDAAESAVLLRRILYDERFRQQLADGWMSVFGGRPEGAAGDAAGRAADVVTNLIPHQQRPRS